MNSPAIKHEPEPGSHTFEIPYPPSVNTYWRNVKGKTLISERGRAYRAEVGWKARTGGVRFGDARLAIEIIAHAPDNRRRDLDNLGKAVLDALAHGQLYTDDSQVDDLRIRRGEIRKPDGLLVITVRAS